MGLSVSGVPAKELKERLRQLQPPVYVAVAPPTSTRWDSKARRLPDILRVSLHVYNTVEEIGFFVEELARIAATARVVAIEK